jgi:hypothetical protein
VSARGRQDLANVKKYACWVSVVMWAEPDGRMRAGEAYISEKHCEKLCAELNRQHPEREYRVFLCRPLRERN